MTSKTVKIAAWTLIILFGFALRATFMAGKTTWHVDEAISFSIVNDNWPIQKDTSYKNRWILTETVSRQVFDNSMENSSFFSLVPKVAEQTAQDVHPPLYYWLLLLFRYIFGAQNHALSGFALNALCYVLSAILLVALTRKLKFNTLMTGAILLCFALARGSVSMTVFIRMYELLQLWVLLFIYFALIIIQKKQSSVKTLLLPLLGLFLATYAGLLTHYYFLFVMVPVALFALIYLIKSRTIKPLRYSFFSIFAAILFAFKTFPAAAYHLWGSYRARESAGTLYFLGIFERFQRFVSYLGIVSKDLFPVLLALALIFIALALTRPWKKKELDHEAKFTAFFFGGNALFLILIIAFSAPYKTGRYIAAFIPIFIIAFAALLNLAAKGNREIILKRKTFSLSIASLLMLIMPIAIIGGYILRPGVNEFHEDYYIDENPYYLRDSAPLIIFSSADAWNWKNMLLYGNLCLSVNPSVKNKTLFITDRDLGFDYNAMVKKLAIENGAPISYLAVDDYFARRPRFKNIGTYGFFSIHEMSGE